MKTYCVVNRGRLYTIQAEDVFQVDEKFAMHEKALQTAISDARPVSVRMPWAWVTHNQALTPFAIGGMVVQRILYRNKHELSI
jgi:hypothetical protein